MNNENNAGSTVDSSKQPIVTTSADIAVTQMLVAVWVFTLLAFSFLAFILGGNYFYKVKTIYVKEIDAQNLPKINNYVKNLNSGGCAFFAYKLYSKLDSTKNKIITFGDTTSFNSSKYSHIAVLSIPDSGVIDCTGYRNIMYHQFTFGKAYKIMPLDTLKSIINNPKRWNDKFNKCDTSTINLFIDRLCNSE